MFYCVLGFFLRELLLVRLHEKKNELVFIFSCIFLGLKLRLWYRNRYPPAAFLDQLQESQPLLSQQNRTSFADPITVDGIPDTSEENDVSNACEVKEVKELKELPEVPDCNQPTSSTFLPADDFVLETIVV